ncbi:MAG TPA: hypothetical protein VD948_07865 [Rhodothermales bacterium]|nr:hypothetical protein [Rhodothermales bacterium]
MASSSAHEHQGTTTSESRPTEEGEEQTPKVQSSIAARRAAAEPDSDEISGDTQESRMPQI